jgi:arsenite methyltransferase
VTDRWAGWLRLRRDGGSEEQRRATLAFLAPIRDKVLDGAALQPGDVLLDVGCGDGLIGLGAIDRGATVIFSDISEDCLDDCRSIAGDQALYRCRAATDLGEVEADVVTTRSVLIYVEDKQGAFDEFFRVLRPHGRISLFEPINRFGMEHRLRTWGFDDVTSIEPLLEKLNAAVAADEGTLIDFDERDLVRFAETAGFDDIHLELMVDVRHRPPDWRGRDWGVFLDSSPNPLVPTLRELIERTLTSEEAARLTAVLRPQVEQGLGTTRTAVAFLTARRP